MNTKIENDLTLVSTSKRSRGMSCRGDRALTVSVCIAIATLAIICFFKTLKHGYFLADDLGEVAYVAKIANGRWDLFWANWTGNYMQIPSMCVYRPWQIVTLLLNYLVSGGNPIGYYATNLAYYIGDAILLFVLCRQLTPDWDKRRSIIAGALAAGLFVVNPLHCETVSWMVGRVDSECFFYYLGAIALFIEYLKNRRAVFMAASIGCFFLAIFVKEMAIGFPVVATALAIMYDTEPRHDVPRLHLMGLVKTVAPIWGATAVYFVIRYLALGTVVGGYSGSIGDNQLGTALKHWQDVDVYHRLFFPFATSVFPNETVLPTILAFAYAGLASVCAIKLLRGEIPVKLAAFCAVWAATTLVPIYKLFGIGLDLEGARFCFFFTAALSALVALVVLAPEREETPPHDMRQLHTGWIDRFARQSVSIVGAVLLLICGGVLFKACVKTNAVWAHAGQEVRAVLQQAEQLAQSFPDNSKIIVLGIPKAEGGAHMIYNGVSFRLGMMPPFLKNNYSQRFLTFDPIIYGDDSYINATRLKESVAGTNVRGPFIWDSAKMQFIDAAPHTMPQAAEPINARGAKFGQLTVDPYSYDYVEVNYSQTGAASKALEFTVTWMGEKEAACRDGRARFIVEPRHYTARLAVSNFWRWYGCGKITNIDVTSSTPGVQIEQLKLVSDKQLRPSLACVNAKSDASGVLPLTSDTRFSIDASSIPGCAQVAIESSKPDYFFHNFERNEQDAVYKTFKVVGNRFAGPLPTGFVPKPQYSEIRARALDKSGNPVGEYSDTIALHPLK